ncbi:MAG: DMT family transporter [Spirochaetales bacterium]|nr:DMT family transporter [Spirochaetales bacterium]
MLFGQFLALLTAACFAYASQVWSFSGKIIGSTRVAHVRLWLALPMVLMVHFLFHGSLFPLGLQPKAYLFFILSGLCGFALADLFIFKALVVLGARQTLVILILSPLFGTLVSWFSLHERISPLQILGIVVIVVGVMGVVYEEGKAGKVGGRKHQGLGVFFALVGAFSQSSANVLSKHGFLYDVHPVSAGVLRIVSGLAGLFLFSLVRGKLVNDFSRLEGKRVLLLLSAAFIGPVLGVVVSLYALRLAPVGVISALMQMSPVLLLPVDRFVYKHRVSLKAVAWTVCAVAGVVILFII